MKLSFYLAASATRPVKLQIESLNGKKERSGGLETVVQTKNAEAFEHFALDLSSFKSVGAGQFVSSDPFVQFTFIIEAPAWPDQAFHQIKIDDLVYASSSK